MRNESKNNEFVSSKSRSKMIFFFYIHKKNDYTKNSWDKK